MEVTRTVVSQTGLRNAAIHTWLTMFKRSIPCNKRTSYLAGVDINDKVRLFMIKSQSRS
jgi:hypothetical protein